MLALTVLDRFGLRVTSDFSIPPGMMAMYALLAVLVFTGVGEVNLRGALAYLGAVTAAALSYLVNAAFEAQGLVSLPALLLLLVLFAPFTASLRPRSDAAGLWRWTVRLYIGFAIFMAFAGIAQFFVQWVYRPEWLFDYTPMIPEAFRASGGWATIISVGEWYKSNGFFLREPSFFSIAMALAILCELSLARRIWVVATLGLGLTLSYSGTGLACLAIGLLFPLGWRAVLRVLAGLVAALLVYLLLGDALNLSYTTNRLGEFESNRSSAYCRFIHPGVAALQQSTSEPWAALLGHGPGSMERMGATCADGHQPTYGKLLFEYGLAGTLAFGLLILTALRRSAIPIRIRATLAATWLLLGANLSTSEVLLAILVLSAIWPEEGREAKGIGTVPASG